MTIDPARFESTARQLESMGVAKMFGMRLVELSLGEAVIELEMRDELRQPGGILHGGVTATLIDTAMAFAVRTYLDEREPTATIDLTIHYLRPLVSGVVRCSASVVRPGKRISTVSAEVFNDEQKSIATAISTYIRLAEDVST